MPAISESALPDSLRVAVLASGRGTNLQALLDAQQDASCRFRVVGVFSDRGHAQALQRARDAGVPAVALQPVDYPTREAFDAALCDAIDAVRPDLVVCAGYLRVLTAEAVQRYCGRLINIHPSLLPLFPGLRTHARALAAGVAEHGASVHYVIPALDAGPAIAQARVPVRADDTAATLAARVLEREHPLLLACVRMIAAGRVLQNGSVVVVDSRPRSEPLLLADDNVLIAPECKPR
jgi:phosphoribosylglycinamide formyltransferase-1